jgi:hypothetical protein
MVRNLTMSQINMTCLEHDVPSLTMFQTCHINLGHDGLEHMVRNLTMSQINLDGFGIWSDLGHQVYQIQSCSRSDLGYPKLDLKHSKNDDLGSSKSKLRFGNIPNHVRNIIAFGLQQRTTPNSRKPLVVRSTRRL